MHALDSTSSITAGGLTTEPARGDRLPGQLGELGERLGPVERYRVEAHPSARVVDHGLRQALGVLVVLMHARDRTGARHPPLLAWPSHHVRRGRGARVNRGASTPARAALLVTVLAG